MTLFLELVIDGLSVGAVYALIALGFVNHFQALLRGVTVAAFRAALCNL